MSLPYVLILFDSTNGSTENLAQHIARGVDSITGIESRIRTVPKVSAETEARVDTIPEKGALYCEQSELAECSGLAIGSPTRFGNMSASLKYFLDGSVDSWMKGALINKPAGAFTSTSSLHGGQESTLLSMMLPLIHQGMCYIGVPYSEESLGSTASGGTPYGPSHWSGHDGNTQLSQDEARIAFAFGKRLGALSLKLRDPS